MRSSLAVYCTPANSIFSSRPTVTPRNFTGAPTSSPWTDSSTYDSARTFLRMRDPAPSTTTAPTATATPASTKAPSLKNFVSALIVELSSSGRFGLSIEKLPHPRIGRRLLQLGRFPGRDDLLHALVEHDHPVGNRVDARQFVGYHHEGDAEA